ncbi:MAG TPA: TonB-dependent receptor [Burkholderiaceae bacterium]
MKTSNTLLYSSITIAILALMNQAGAQQVADQNAAAPTVQSNAQAGSQDAAVKAEVQQIVVTGVASGGSRRKIDSGYSITTATEEQMKEAGPTSTADLMKISPGVYVESTGGQTGANIQIRGFPSGGDAPFVTLQLNGSPLFPAPTLSFLANDSTFRIDDTIARAEILRGGPSVIYSNGQPGATMNFILKQGEDTPEGSIRATYGTGNLIRYDMFYGGKLSEGWYGSIGGFYRTDNGVRDAGFPADNGGSITATLSHKITDGEMLFYVRGTDDKNAFYTGVPVVLQPNGQLSAYPGVNPLTFTPMNNETRLFTLPDGTKGDLADGRGARNVVLGFDFNQKVDGWDVNNKMNFFKGDQPTIALFGGPTPLTMSAQIANFATGAGATGGTGVYVDGGGTVAGTTQTIQYGLWDVDKKLQNFTDELRFTKEIVKDHTVTMGLYASQYSSDDVWNLGNNLLIDLSGRPIQVTLNNGVQATNASGFTSGCGFCIAENGNTGNRAIYVADEWKLNEALRLDAGVRYEHQQMSLAFQSPSTVNGVSQPNGPVISYNDDWNLTSFTAGGIYKLAKDMSVFARFNSGGQFPFFDQVRGSSTTNPPPETKIKQFELGFKNVNSFYTAFVNLFANQFTNQFLGLSNANGQPFNTVGGSKTYGVEYEFAIRPIKDLQIAWSGDMQHARYQDYNDSLNPGINGFMVQRQPASQWRLTPSYFIPLGSNSLKLYSTYSFINARYDDQQNQQYLPSYHTLDAGALLEVGEKLEFRLSGNNLTNELGLTEGSAGRVVSTPGSIPYASIGRPLFGRTVELSVKYRFD